MNAKRLYDKEGNWVGVQRIVVEYWAVGSEEWTFTPLDFDPEKSQRVSKLPMGIEHLPRRKLRKRTY